MKNKKEKFFKSFWFIMGSYNVIAYPILASIFFKELYSIIVFCVTYPIYSYIILKQVAFYFHERRIFNKWKKHYIIKCPTFSNEYISLLCDFCGGKVSLDFSKKDEYESIISRGQLFIKSKCPSCGYKSYIFNQLDKSEIKKRFDIFYYGSMTHNLYHNTIIFYYGTDYELYKETVKFLNGMGIKRLIHSIYYYNKSYKKFNSIEVKFTEINKFFMLSSNYKQEKKELGAYNKSNIGLFKIKVAKTNKTKGCV